MLSDDIRGLWSSCRMVASIFEVSVRHLIHHTFWNMSIADSDADFRRFARIMLEISETTVIAVGQAHIQAGQSYVFMSNHQSLMDIPVLCHAIPVSLRMVTKEQLMKIPVFGPAMLKAGFIPLDRGNRKKAFQQLEIAKARLKSGISIWIAPEGTRNRADTREMLPFKKGGFHIAVDLGVPIIPVWIEGSNRIIPPHHSTIVHGQTVEVRIGTPISTQEIDKNMIGALAEHVRDEIIQLSKMRSSTSTPTGQ